MGKQSLGEVVRSAKNGREIIQAPAVGDKFKNVYATVHGIRNIAQAEAFYQAEQFHFLKIINDNENVRKCTPMSLYGIFMDVAVSGLSFDPTMKHLYIVPFNTNVGTKNNPQWEKRASLMISPYGELLLRKNQGQIQHADNPMLVYDGDVFEYGTRDGKVFLNHIRKMGNELSRGIIACYLKITRADGTTDYKVLSLDEFEGLRKFSKDQNSMAWTTGRAGMFQAKTIKHAFRTYPKFRIGKFSQVATIEQAGMENEIQDIDYGIDIDTETGEIYEEETQQQLPEGTTILVPQPTVQQQAQPIEVQQQQAPAKQTGIKFDNPDSF